MTFEEMLIAGRAVQQRDADFSHHVRNLLAEGGVLRVLVGMILESRDGMVESVVRQDLLSDQGRLTAIKAQGLVAGMDQVLQIIWASAQEEENDEQDHDEAA